MNRRGYILLPVVLALTLVAAAALLISRQGGAQLQLAAEGAEAAQARYLAEAGLQHAIWQAQTSGCSDYALAETPFGGGSYQAQAQPSGGSPVTITATGRLSSGVEHTLMRRQVRVYQDSAKVSLQPGPVEGKDGYVNAQAKASNYGASPRIGVDSGGAHDYYALLHFDPAAALPPGVELVEVVLQLYLESFGGNSNAKFTLYPMAQDWTEGTGSGTRSNDGASYNTADGVSPWSWPACYQANRPVAVAAVNPTLEGWHSWDITSLVVEWLAGETNHGVVIVGNNQVRDAFFTSSDAPLETYRPRLQLTYACECSGGEGQTLVLQPGAGDGRDTHLLDGQSTSNFGSLDRIYVSQKSNRVHHGLLRFDLSSIPVGATVAAATLNLNLDDVSSQNGGMLDIHRATRPWSETNATWNLASAGVPWSVAGGDYDPLPSASTWVDYAALGTYAWDLTPLVAGWAAGTWSNDGMVLALSGAEVDSAKFTSSDGSSAALRPKLTVVYRCPCGVDCSAVPPHIYRDEFNSRTCDAGVDYAGSDGTLDWSPWSWNEVGEAVDPCTGGMRLVDDLGSNRLSLRDSGKGANRQLDLSGFSEAYLQFDHRRQFNGNGETAVVMVSADGGSEWVSLDIIAGTGIDPNYTPLCYDITPYIAADTLIGFQAFNFQSGTDILFLDNVQVGESCEGTEAPLVMTLAPAADTWIRQNEATSNFGSDTQMQVGADAAWNLMRMMVKFDLSALPAGANVTGATLRFYVLNTLGASDKSVGLYRILGDWAEDTVTWNSTGGGAFDPTPLSSNVLTWSEGWKEMSVPPGLIHEWIDGASPNRGLLLDYLGDKKNYTLKPASKEHATAAWHPQLVIEYTEP